MFNRKGVNKLLWNIIQLLQIMVMKKYIVKWKILTSVIKRKIRNIIT